MAQNYGVGGGLASLIPKKNPPSEGKATEKKETTNETGALSEETLAKVREFGLDKKNESPSEKEKILIKKENQARTESVKMPVIEKEIKSANSNVSNGDLEVSINLVDSNPQQPRLAFDEEKLAGLTESIKHH